MFEYYYFVKALELVKQLPKEVIYGTAAFVTITELHKRHCYMKIKLIEATEGSRQIELEVEKLRLEIEKLEKSNPAHPAN